MMVHAPSLRESPAAVVLYGSRGPIEAHIGDQFNWHGVGGGRWRIEAFTSKRIYSPSGLGGTIIVRCAPIDPPSPYWSDYLNPDGTADWCGDSVASALVSARQDPTSTPSAQ